MSLCLLCPSRLGRCHLCKASITSTYPAPHSCLCFLTSMALCLCLWFSSLPKSKTSKDTSVPISPAMGTLLSGETRCPVELVQAQLLDFFCSRTLSAILKRGCPVLRVSSTAPSDFLSLCHCQRPWLYQPLLPPWVPHQLPLGLHAFCPHIILSHSFPST